MPLFNVGDLFWIPRGRFCFGELADDFCPRWFEFDSGVEHEHVRAAREERFGAGDARRAGTDDAVHGAE